MRRLPIKIDVACDSEEAYRDIPDIRLYHSRPQAHSKMKVAVLLTVAIAVASAFDFPEEWEAWKVVSL